MWPFSRHTEDRQATGGYTGIISALIELQAAGTTQQASATAATEATAGALSRAFADARVDGPADIVEALSPRTLAQIGRDLVRVGESLHVIRMSGGRLHLFPASTWYWQGDADPATWLCTATLRTFGYGPWGSGHISSTWRLPGLNRRPAPTYPAGRDPLSSPLTKSSLDVGILWCLADADGPALMVAGHAAARSVFSPGTWAADTSRLTANAERWRLALTKRAGLSRTRARRPAPEGRAPGWIPQDDTEGYRGMLERLAQESGIETPTAEDLARLDRKRKGKKLSNQDWVSRSDPEAKIG